MKKVALMAFVGALVVGCSQEVKTVDFYVENADARKEMLKDCETRQGSHQDKNCMNASQAHQKAKLNQLLGK